MKLLLLVALMVGVCAAANHPTECGPLQILKVKHQWAVAFDYGEHREELDEDVWEEIFEQHPEYRTEIFSRVRGENTFSPEFRAHAARIVGQFDSMITMLDEPDALQADITHIGAKHKQWNVPDEAFDLFRKAIMHAVQKRIGLCFNFDAWELCTTKIEDGLKEAMHAAA